MAVRSVLGMQQLPDDETAILDFERHWYRSRGRKEDAILTTFGCSPTTYYAQLNALIDRDEALAVDPMLVRRLRRLRTARRKARTSARVTAPRRLEFMPYRDA